MWIIRAGLGVLLLLGLVALAAMAADKQLPSSFFRAREVHSPGDWVKEEQIKVYPDNIILDIPGATWASFTNTNSMDPLLDEGVNALEIKPLSPEQISIGDVISYHSSYGLIVHRVMEKGIDERGFFYLVKGDNNSIQDPAKVRFEQVEGVVVAVIY